MSNTRIKNLSSAKIVINLPGARYLRELMPKQEVRISDDALDEFNYDQGCINFVREGYISVVSDDENNIVVKPEGLTAATIDVKHLLTDGTISELSETLKTATESLKDEIVDTAIKLSIADEPHCNIIKHFTGVDILKAISLQRAN